jgi:hypothetical protein
MRKRGAFVSADSSFRIFPAVFAVAVGVFGLTGNVEAQGTTPFIIPSTEFSSGMVGLSAGQTARLNVVNIGVPTTPALPCVMALAFLDSNSKSLKQSFVSLKSGQAAFLDLSSDEAGASAQNDHKTDSPQRVPIRGVGYNPLLAAGPAIPQPLSCALVPTLELFDTETGRLTAVVTNFRTPGSSGTPQL